MSETILVAGKMGDAFRAILGDTTVGWTKDLQWAFDVGAHWAVREMAAAYTRAQVEAAARRAAIAMGDRIAAKQMQVLHSEADENDAVANALEVLDDA